MSANMVIGAGGSMRPSLARSQPVLGLRFFPWANAGRWDVAYCVPGSNTRHSLMSCITLSAALSECRRLNGDGA